MQRAGGEPIFLGYLGTAASNIHANAPFPASSCVSVNEELVHGVPGARVIGEGTGEVSQRFRVSRKSVERFWKQHQLTGHCRPKQIGGDMRIELA